MTEQGVTAIFGSKSASHIRENLAVNNFTLGADLRAILERSNRPLTWTAWAGTQRAQEGMRYNDCVGEWARYFERTMRDIRRPSKEMGYRRVFNVSAFVPKGLCYVADDITVSAASRLAQYMKLIEQPFVVIPPHFRFDGIDGDIPSLLAEARAVLQQLDGRYAHSSNLQYFGPIAPKLQLCTSQVIVGKVSERFLALLWLPHVARSLCSTPSDGNDRRISQCELSSKLCLRFKQSRLVQEVSMCNICDRHKGRRRDPPAK